MSEITTANIADLCQNILKDGKYEVARRVYMIISQVFELAILEEIVLSNPADILSKSKSFFPQHIALNYAVITDPS